MNIGSKYQSFDGDKRIVYRAIKALDNDQVELLNLETKETITKSIDELSSSMIEILPDAIIDIMLTESDNDDGGIYNDIYACVYRCDEIVSDKFIPAIILRQDTYSYTKNGLYGQIGGKIYVGDCITREILPWDGPITDMCEFDKVNYNYSIYSYANDKLDDIFTCIPEEVLSKFNNVLKELTKKNSDTIVGYCNDLKYLFEDNKFIASYRSIFNIHQVYFPIVLGSQSYNDDGDIIINNKQKQKIENLIRKYIKNVKVIEYDHDIDVSEIVAYDHILLSDITENIYLIAYEVTGDYPTDPDVMHGMGLVN